MPPLFLTRGPVLERMSAGIARKLQAAFPDVPVVEGMNHSGRLRVADGRVLEVNQKTSPGSSFAYQLGPGSIFIRGIARKRQCGDYGQFNPEGPGDRRV